jgi:predicted nuclease of restriction endonuclease-like (RecB) superfamily
MIYPGRTASRIFISPKYLFTMHLPTTLVQDIKSIWTMARSRTATLVNTALVNAYWEIGHRIVEEEQHGSRRADYGDALLQSLAITLTAELDKHLDERELRRIRQFYLVFPIRDALRPDLSWTHYRLLLRIEDPKARLYYMQEAAEQGWKTRQLERNIQSGYYNRILVHREAGLPTEPTGTVPLTATDLLKDPYVLEFLGLDMPAGYSESDLETAILSKLHHFLLEMLCKGLHNISYV